LLCVIFCDLNEASVRLGVVLDLRELISFLFSRIGLDIEMIDRKACVEQLSSFYKDRSIRIFLNLTHHISFIWIFPKPGNLSLKAVSFHSLLNSP
jgi:hypothetical protein